MEQIGYIAGLVWVSTATLHRQCMYETPELGDF
jgi:hypothetical protein